MKHSCFSEEINNIFLPIEDLSGIFIGGPGPSKEKFVNDVSLDYRLREKIIDVVERKTGSRNSHTFIYKLTNKQTYKLVFILNKKPKIMITAFYVGGNVEKILMKSYGFRF